MDKTSNKGRPKILRPLCSCCGKEFANSKTKGNHEAYMRNAGKFRFNFKASQSVLTPSINHDLKQENIDISLFKSFATPVDKSATSATTDDTLLKTLEKTPQY